MRTRAFSYHDVGAIIGLVFAACGLAAISSCSDVSKEKFEPDFKLESQLTENAVVFSVSTNLPNGTELVSEFQREGSPGGPQSKAIVSTGRAQFEPMSDAGSMFAPGSYVFTVTVPLIEGQPTAVKRRLGLKGENLTGQYVIDDSLGRYVERSWSIKLKPIE